MRKLIYCMSLRGPMDSEESYGLLRRRSLCQGGQAWQSNTSGFTIVELIAVIAIISVLTGLLLAGVAKVRASAKIKKAKATIEQLEAALEMYAQNWGTYAPDQGSSNLVGGKFTRCSELIGALEAEYPSAKERGGPYVKYPAELKSTSGPAIGSLLDPWGEPYRYHWDTDPLDTPSGPNVTAIGQGSGQRNITYNIWSIGPNKINDEWRPSSEENNTYYPNPPPPDLQRSYSDDIVNW